MKGTGRSDVMLTKKAKSSSRVAANRKFHSGWTL